MNIFGFTLSAADLWLLGIAGFLIMLLLGVYVPAEIKCWRDAATEFRGAFDSILLNLTENPSCPLAIFAYQENAGILAAISKFRGFVPLWSRRSFKRDVAHYKDAYSVATEDGAAYAVGLFEDTEHARNKRAYFHDAVNRLIRHAKHF